jgi:hypothetical protein
MPWAETEKWHLALHEEFDSALADPAACLQKEKVSRIVPDTVSFHRRSRRAGRLFELRQPLENQNVPICYEQARRNEPGGSMPSAAASRPNRYMLTTSRCVVILTLAWMPSVG